MPKSCLKCLLPFLPLDPQSYGLHTHCFVEWFEVPSNAQFSSLVLRSESKAPSDGNNESDNSSFFHGQFRKYSAVLGNRKYILKVQQQDAPELPDVEYLCNQIAEKLGIPVARYYCVEFFSARAFVTKNFIDSNEHADLSHIHTHIPEGKKSNCETLIEVIATVTGRFPDVEIFIMTCLFDSLIGNHDRHGRNLGFIVTPRGTRLSPIYDNPSVLGLHSGAWLQADFAPPPGRVPTNDEKNPSLRDYVKEFERLGYAEQVRAFAKKAKFENIKPLIDRSFCSEAMKSAITKLIDSRLKELQDAII